MVKAGDGKPRSDKRRASDRFVKRLTAEQSEALKARARAAGYETPHAYLTAIIQGDVDPGVMRGAIQTLGELGKIGSNINQIARLMNSGILTQVTDEDMETIERAAQLVEEVAAEIREKLREVRSR